MIGTEEEEEIENEEENGVELELPPGGLKVNSQPNSVNMGNEESSLNDSEPNFVTTRNTKVPIGDNMMEYNEENNTEADLELEGIKMEGVQLETVFNAKADTMADGVMHSRATATVQKTKNKQ